MNKQVELVARRRLAASENQIKFAFEKIRQGNPFAAEKNENRRRSRLQIKAGITPRAAEAMSEKICNYSNIGPATLYTEKAADEVVSTDQADRRERIYGDTVDFVNVAFLERGSHVARSVGRITFTNGRAQGSGVLIGNGLLLTNNHVIQSASQSNSFVVEFDYERDWAGQQRPSSKFLLDPSVFITDSVEGLDFTIIGVGDSINSDLSLQEFGYSGLSDAQDKHMIGEFANIVQHPQGRYKEVVLRENRLVNRFEDALHYVADTEPGSSGSPVYNSEWQMIALHHWGGPWIAGNSNNNPINIHINEGIRISSIVRKLRKRIRYLAPSVARKIQGVLDSQESFHSKPSQSRFGKDERNGESNRPQVKVDDAGRATWTFPVEFSVQLPHLSPAEPNQPTELDNGGAGRPISASRESDETSDYDDREGYHPQFLSGFTVPLPELGPGIRDDAATLLNLQPGQHPHELKYHHFSVVVNRRRKLAFYTACNIDGATSKSIGRRNRNVGELEPTDSGLREVVRNLDGAEGDDWDYDPRILKSDYSGIEIYEGQVVPGFPNPRSSGRIKRMFQKGHLVRRLDPAWGTNNQALAAELDTFHWTNAAPQVGFFNQGRADEDQPGTGNGKLWRAAENYVLRNAVAEGQRVTSFTGPIFRDDDRAYRNIQIPGAFFKLTCWVSSGNLRSLAMIVDQAQVFDNWPESIFNGSESITLAEAFQDADELEKVQDFLSTVEELEDLTELDFGDAVRNADIRRGERREKLSEETEPPLSQRIRNTPIGVRPINLMPDPKGEKDNLKEIKGIGQQLERRLNDHGVFYYRQISEWSPEEVEYMEENLRTRGRVKREDWVGQAKRLMK